LFCHREDEHDWQTANNKQRARNLHLDEFNDDDEKDATEGKIILIEAGKIKKLQGAHRQHTMFVEGILVFFFGMWECWMLLLGKSL